MNDGWRTKPRVVLAVWLGILFAVVGVLAGYRGLVVVAALTVWPAAIIWFGDALNYMMNSRLFGRRLLPPIAGPTPGILFGILGWILLALATLLAVGWLRARP